MTLAIITLLTAIGISAVAAYYSIVGLMAIFSAAAMSIAIMGIVLEIGKLIRTPPTSRAANAWMKSQRPSYS